MCHAYGDGNGPVAIHRIAELVKSAVIDALKGGTCNRGLRSFRCWSRFLGPVGKQVGSIHGRVTPSDSEAIDMESGA